MIVQGTVVDGHVVLDENIPDGTRVTVLVESDDAVTLGHEDIVELQKRIADIERGEFVQYSDVEALIEDLAKNRG